MEQIRVSVAMAVRNGGGGWLYEQIDSILPMLEKSDELVISYDPSTDDTWEIIKKYERSDKRIRVVVNSGSHSVVGNFNNAILSSRGRYIFLADQDDYWVDNKIAAMVSYLEKPGAAVAVCNGYLMRRDGTVDTQNTLFTLSQISKSPVKNLIKGTYWGCCMAFSARLVPVICPIPEGKNMCHDLWIGVLGALNGRIELVDQCFVLHRIHENNQTRPLSLLEISENRLYFLYKLTARQWKCRRHKK